MGNLLMSGSGWWHWTHASILIPQKGAIGREYHHLWDILVKNLNLIKSLVRTTSWQEIEVRGTYSMTVEIKLQKWKIWGILQDKQTSFLNKWIPWQKGRRSTPWINRSETALSVTLSAFLSRLIETKVCNDRRNWCGLLFSCDYSTATIFLSCYLSEIHSYVFMDAVI